MSIKWETVKAGDTLYSVVRRKMGNTNIRGDYVHAIVVKEIDHAAGRAVVYAAHLGGTVPVWKRRVEKWRRTPPARKKGGLL